MEELTDVRHMKGEELSHFLHVYGEKYARADVSWFWAQESKKIMQSELTLKYEKTEGVTKAQHMARIDKSFIAHIEQMKEILEHKNICKVRYDEIQTEIRRRLNAQFRASQEMKSGGTHA